MPSPSPARMRACIADLIAERDDALLAIAEEHTSQQLGLPSYTIGAFRAWTAKCEAAITALHSGLLRLDALDAVLSARIRGVRTARPAGAPHHEPAPFMAEHPVDGDPVLSLHKE